jgi:outer membrane protein TolC
MLPIVRRGREVASAVAFISLGSRLSIAHAQGNDMAALATRTAEPEVASVVVGGPVRAMTLDAALAYARAHQPLLLRALARVAASNADTQVPRAQWLPSLGATAQALEGTTNNTTASYLGVPDVEIPRIGGTTVGGLTEAGRWRPHTSTLAAVGLGQEIFDFGRIAAQAAVADATAQAERHRGAADRLRVDLMVRDTFFAVEGARAVQRAAGDAYARSRVHRDMAAAAVRTGLHAPIELTRAEADLTRFDVNRTRAEGALRTAQATFAAAVGVEDRLLDAAGDPPPLAAAPPIEQGLDRAAHQDPLLNEARARVDSAVAQARAISAELRPDLQLTATLSGRAGTAAPSGTGTLSEQVGPLPTVPNWDAGLVLRWALYDPVVGARRDAATRRADVARADVAVLARRQSAAVQDAYVTLQVGEAVLVGLQRAVAAARDNYAQADARFKAGLGTSLELADAESLRTDAEIQLAVGQFDTRRARALVGSLIAEGL